MTLAVELDGLPKDLGIAAEMPLPETMTQNYHPIAMRHLLFRYDVWKVLFLREGASERRLDSEHRKEIGRNLMALNLLGRPAAGERFRTQGKDCGHLFKD